MSRSELQFVLDFILNRADEAEFEVVKKACERRNRDGGAFAALGASSPAVMAKTMAQNLQKQMGVSLESIRAMSRNFIAEIIRKNAPEIGEEELEELLASYLPEPGQKREKKAEPSPLPPEALLAMVREFIAYSEGSMAPSRQRELWEEMPRWQEAYWEAFPAEIKALVKACLDGRLDPETFTAALLSTLGL